MTTDTLEKPRLRDRTDRAWFTGKVGNPPSIGPKLPHVILCLANPLPKAYITTIRVSVGPTVT